MSEFIGITLFNLVIPPIISIAVNKALVERAQKMRVHSEKLVQLSLSALPDQIKSILPLGAKYDDESRKYVSLSREDINYFPHSEFMVEHIKSGYTKLWKQWNELEKSANDYCEAEVVLRNKIREIIHEIADTNSTAIFYHRTGRVAPSQWIMPVYVTDAIMFELNYRYEGNEGLWVFGKPGHQLTRLGGGIQTHHVTFGDRTVAQIHSNDKVGQLITAFTEIPDNDEIIQLQENVKTLKGKYDAIEKKLLEEISEIISRVKLGENLKGHCDVCPSIF